VSDQPDVEPLPDILPDTLAGLRELRARIHNARHRCLSELRVRQQLLHHRLVEIQADVHARLDANAIDALQEANAFADAWDRYNDQLHVVDLAIVAAIRAEQTGTLL
jgi:hypothetical protein